jgi:hypothetical protein
MKKEFTIQELITLYREAAIGTSDPNPNKANNWAKKLLKQYNQLRITQEGRNAISNLMNDPNPHVRCWASSHSLEWIPKVAIVTLEELIRSGGSCAFDAQMVLSEYQKGNLSFDS